MNEILLNLAQAVSLLAFVPCVVVIFYLAIFSRNNKIIILPILYFVTIGVSLLIILLPAFIQLDKLPALGNILISLASFMPALIFLLIIQLLSGDLPRKIFYLVIIPSVFIECLYLYALLLDSSETVIGITDLRFHELVPLFRVLIALSIFGILTIYISRTFKWKANFSISLKYKYWLIIQLIIFNIAMLALNLFEISNRFPNENYNLIYAILIATFEYLIISSMFRVFTEEFYDKALQKQFEKPEFADFITDVAKKIELLMKEEKPYRRPGFNREALAKKLHIQEAQLSYIINSHYNKSFTELSNDYRVTDAKKMLIESDEPVTVICFDTGFNSLTSFNRVFKAHTNMAPSEFRSFHESEKNGTDEALKAKKSSHSDQDE
jgi:AraC-like DNA-binding protein